MKAFDAESEQRRVEAFIAKPLFPGVGSIKFKEKRKKVHGSVSYLRYLPIMLSSSVFMVP